MPLYSKDDSKNFEIIGEIIGYNGEIHWDTARPDGTPKKLLDISVVRDSLRNAIRSVKVKINVDDEEVTLGSGNYLLPVEVGNVQIDCPIVKDYYTNSGGDSWGLSKDARFRLWPKDSPFMEPGTFVYPIRRE